MPLFDVPSPLGLPYCRNCLGVGCDKCRHAQMEMMRKIAVVDGFLDTHLNGKRLDVSSKESLMELLHAAIMFGRRQAEGSASASPPEEVSFDRFNNLDYLPKEAETGEPVIEMRSRAKKRTIG